MGNVVNITSNTVNIITDDTESKCPGSSPCNDGINSPDDQNQFCNSEDYHHVIREMIKNEDEIKNSRNNWFLAIQGFLVNGICKLLSIEIANDFLKLLLVAIALLGVFTSVSFLYASWRSLKSIDMALKCWDLYLEKNKKRIQDFPPVGLITQGIISRLSQENKIGEKDWENDIYNRMYSKRGTLKEFWDNQLNKIDWIMPFRIIPLFLIIFWLFILWKISVCIIL